MKKIVFLLLISFGINAQTRIKYSQMENPATSSVNLGTQTFSVSTITGSVTMGTGTVAANTSSLGIVRIKQGSSWADFGEGSSNAGMIWFNQSSNTISNYSFFGDANNTRINAPNGTLFLRVGNANRMVFDVGSSYHINPLRIGSAVSPSATLDVTGTMSVSSMATVGGLTTSGNITTTGSGSLTIAPNYARLGNLYLNTVATNSLTTGNTGTVAVLSDAVFGMSFSGTNGTFADATTYYLSTMPFPFQPISTGAIWPPYNCTLVGWDCTTYASNTPSTETSTLQIYIDGVATNLSTNISFTNSSAAATTFTARGLSQSITANSKVEPRFITNTMATNPTSACITVTFWFVRRQ